MIAAMLTLILTGLVRVVRTHRALVLENLALRHQVAVLQRTTRRPRLRRSDRGRVGGTDLAARRSPWRFARSSAEWPRPTPCGARRGFTGSS